MHRWACPHLPQAPVGGVQCARITKALCPPFPRSYLKVRFQSPSIQPSPHPPLRVCPLKVSSLLAWSFEDVGADAHLDGVHTVPQKAGMEMIL